MYICILKLSWTSVLSFFEAPDWFSKQAYNWPLWYSLASSTKASSGFNPASWTPYSFTTHPSSIHPITTTSKASLWGPTGANSPESLQHHPWARTNTNPWTTFKNNQATQITSQRLKPSCWLQVQSAANVNKPAIILALALSEMTWLDWCLSFKPITIDYSLFVTQDHSISVLTAYTPFFTFVHWKFHLCLAKIYKSCSILFNINEYAVLWF